MPAAVRSSFVADGWSRACSALEPAIREQVIAEFAERWRTATYLQRIKLRLAIRREIARRIKQLAPPDALY